MKTLTITEAADNLAGWLKRAIAGEEIVIRSDNAVVALRPLPPVEPAEFDGRGKGMTRTPPPSRVKAGQSKIPDFMARLRANRSRPVFSAGDRHGPRNRPQALLVAACLWEVRKWGKETLLSE